MFSEDYGEISHGLGTGENAYLIRADKVVSVKVVSVKPKKGKKPVDISVKILGREEMTYVAGPKDLFKSHKRASQALRRRKWRLLHEIKAQCQELLKQIQGLDSSCGGPPQMTPEDWAFKNTGVGLPKPKEVKVAEPDVQD